MPGEDVRVFRIYKAVAAVAGVAYFTIQQPDEDVDVTLEVDAIPEVGSLFSLNYELVVENEF